MTRIKECNTAQDIEDLIYLGKFHRDECGAHLPFDPEWTRKWAEYTVKDTDRTYTNIFLAYKDKEPQGFLIGHARPYVFTEAVSATQELWFVRKEYRATRVAYKLIQAFEEWARLRGAVEIFTGVVNDDAATVSKVSSVLKRMGYPQVGTYHKKRTV